MKTTLAQRLRQARKDAGLSQKELGEAVRVTQAAIQKLESGSAQNSTKLIEIANALNVSPEWLSSGKIKEKKTFLESKKSPTTLPREREIKDTYKVEILDIQASAGKGVMIHDEFIETIKSIEYTNQEANKLFGGRPEHVIKIITVKGDSMAGTFESRDQIFVDTSINYFDGDGIYVFVLDNQLYIKRLQRQNRRLAVISDNPRYETWYLDEKEVKNLLIHAKVLISQSINYKFYG